jgi:hypothetical protein
MLRSFAEKKHCGFSIDGSFTDFDGWNGECAEPDVVF